MNLLAMPAIGAPVFAPSSVWVTNGPNGATVTALAVDPAQPAIVYAGTGNGLFRSDDSGVASEPRGGEAPRILFRVTRRRPYL